MYPIADDVTLSTEEIVRYGRCEMRAAVIDQIAQDKKRLDEIVAKQAIREKAEDWLSKNNLTPATATTEKRIMALVHAIGEIVEAQQKINRGKYDELLNCRDEGKPDVVVKGEGKVACPQNSRELKEKLGDLKKLLGKQLGKKLGRAGELRPYLDVAVVYDFEFEITEQNQTKGDLAFKLPLVSKVVDADASAALLLTRKGKRSFKTQDGKWGKLISADKLCKDFSAPRRNVLYPLGGSIGVDRVVTTFIDLIDQGGSKDSFVDALIFTTDVSGGVGASIKLSPVPNSFRLVSAEASLFGSRLDVHKLTLSLVFPKQESSEAIFGVDRFEGDLDTPFSRPADWRARYNLCVADARGREEALKQLRETAPEIYCIQYADFFDPQYEGDENRKNGRLRDARGAPMIHHHLDPPRDRDVPPIVPPRRRPNFIPY